MNDRTSRRAAMALVCVAALAVLRLMWGGQQTGKPHRATSYSGFDHDAHIREHLFDVASGPRRVDITLEPWIGQTDDFWFTITFLDNHGQHLMTDAISTDQR